MLLSSRSICGLLFASMLGLTLPLWADATTQLTVYTVYDSPTCEGKVVQNNYVAVGTCTANTTCGDYSINTDYGVVTGCCNSDPASTSAYSASIFGSDVDAVTWIIYADNTCETFVVGSESQMTMSLATSRCNPLEDGTSKKFTFDSSKSVTSLQYANGNCSDTPINSTLSAADMGKCIPIGSMGLMGFATINGTTYGVTSSASALNALGTAALVALSALWAVL